MPTVAELRLAARTRPEFPSHNIFSRFGDVSARRVRLHRYCLDSDEFRDLAPLCAPRALAEEDVAADDSPITPPTDVGVVYLIRAGRHFKVGRTTSLDRRTRQLAIQLPERAVAVHAIRTDDPAGIERYWHGRFAAQRLNGEWFALTAADVSAFRRRKFM